MTGTYWKRCPEAVLCEGADCPSHPAGGFWYCDCHDGLTGLALVRVPDGALPIEDSDAAVARMMEAAHDQGDDGWYRMLLAAAVGE